MTDKLLRAAIRGSSPSYQQVAYFERVGLGVMVGGIGGPDWRWNEGALADLDNMALQEVASILGLFEA